MSLPVPLNITIGDVPATREVQSLSFRKEAVGGVRSISFGLSRSLTDLAGLDPLARVVIYDGRSAIPIAEGRFSDPGRTADPNGQRWDCVAFGPAQHASDVKSALIYVDRDRGAWTTGGRTAASLEFSDGTKPDSTPGGIPGLTFTVEQGTTVANGDYAEMRYTRIRDAGMKLGGFAFNYDQGLTAGDIYVQSIISAGGNHSPGFYDVGPTYSWNTAGGTGGADIVTHFANGRDTVDLRNAYGGAGGAVGAGWWSWIGNITVRGMVYNKDGTEVTNGYILNPHIYAHSVVADLLGRGMLPEFDGVNASVGTASTTLITQLAYEGGVTAEQVLQDLMGFEPAYRWTTGPSGASGKYSFRWEEWPTAVRYEATLNDGGSFPLSTQSLYNRVWVQFRDESGVARNVLRTRACPLLDDKGLVRQEFLQLGSEAGTTAQANAAGDNFLAEHNVPKNAGTLTVARPIRDVITGAMVMPWEIEPGELIRIQGVEAYPDAFNTTTNDGQGVFRIHAVDYNSEGNRATLSLDSDPKTTEDALVALLNQRSR